MTNFFIQHTKFKISYITLLTIKVFKNPIENVPMMRSIAANTLVRFPKLLKVALRIIYRNKSVSYQKVRFHGMTGIVNNDDLMLAISNIPVNEIDLNILYIKKKIANSDKNEIIEHHVMRNIAANYDINRFYNSLKLPSMNNLQHTFQSNFGGGNVGLVLHSSKENPIFFTKIIRYHNQPISQSVEQYFYTDLRSSIEELKQFTPELISMYTEGEFGFLTMSYIQGRTPTIEDIEAVFDFQSVLFHINHDSIKKHLSKKIYTYVFNPKIVLTPLSYRQHKHTIKKNLLIAENKMPHKDLQKDRLLLDKLVLKFKFLNKINIYEDLVLQHHQLVPLNCKINQRGILVVYDWASYSLALPGIDLLCFIMSFTFDFNVIHEKCFSFLKKENISNYYVVTFYLTLMYLSGLLQQPEGVRIEEDWDLAIEYLKKSPLYN